MKSIKVNILGKQYPLCVKDSEVDSMVRIAEYVDHKFRQYKSELNKQPETTVMVLACLSIAEELFEERKKSEKFNYSEDDLMKKVNLSLEEILEELDS